MKGKSPKNKERKEFEAVSSIENHQDIEADDDIDFDNDESNQSKSNTMKERISSAILSKQKNNNNSKYQPIIEEEKEETQESSRAYSRNSMENIQQLVNPFARAAAVTAAASLPQNNSPLYSDSDDEDEEIAELNRYSFAAASTVTRGSPMKKSKRNEHNYDIVAERKRNKALLRTSNKNDELNHKKSFLSSSSSPFPAIQTLYTNIKETHETSKQKYAERALQERLADDSDGNSSFCFFRIRQCLWIMDSYCCDSITTSQGILGFLCLLLMYSVLYYIIIYEISVSEDNGMKKDTKNTVWWIFGGILIILIRLFWKTCYWYLWARRVEERRQNTMAIYDELNGEAGTAGFEIPQQQNDEKLEIRGKNNMSFDYEDYDKDNNEFEEDLEMATVKQNNHYARSDMDDDDSNSLGENDTFVID